MKRHDVLEFIASAADRFIERMEAEGADPSQQLGTLHAAARDGVLQIDELVERGDKVSDDEYSQELVLRLVKIAAAAAAALVIQPLERADLKDLVAIVQRMGHA